MRRNMLFEQVGTQNDMEGEAVSRNRGDRGWVCAR